MVRTLPRRQILGFATSLLSLTMLLACQNNDQNASVDLATWAEEYCATATELDAVVLDLPFYKSDLSSFEQAREDLEQSVPMLSAATDHAIRRLNAANPPAIAAEFHSMTIEYRQAQFAAFDEMLPAWRAASKFEDVDASTIELRSTLARANTRIAEVPLPEEVRAAFDRVGDCGSLVEARIYFADNPVAPDEHVLLFPGDLLTANWRGTQFDDSDFEQAGRTPIDPNCLAELPTINLLGGPLNATWTIDPKSWSAVFLFNGAMGLDGSQIWSEVWAFDAPDSARTSFQHTRDVMNTAQGPSCLDTSDELDKNANGYESVSDPAFQLPDSVSYALDSRSGEGRSAIDSHIEVHMIQRGRFVGMVVLYDHGPAELWQIDGPRVLELFDAHLTAAATE